jgi:hypothetical protein
MTTHITRSGNNRRLRLVTAEEANATGKAEAQRLLAEVFPADQNRTPADALHAALAEFIALAHDNRYEECDARLKGFCEVIGPVLHRRTVLSAALNKAAHVAKANADEQRAIHAAIATCSLVSAGRIVAAHSNDDDAIVTLAELRIAVQALEPKFTETEGGEL